MSYPIIFKTKVILLSDGRILFLQRSGCNNDDAGREKDFFNVVKLYTEEEFNKEVEKFENAVSGEDFDLKIGSRYCTLKDYASHLRRMRKRVETFQSVKETAVVFHANVINGIDRFEEAEDGTSVIKHYSNEEWNSLSYKERYYSGVSFSINRALYNEEKDFIKALEDKKPIEVKYIPISARFKKAS